MVDKPRKRVHHALFVDGVQAADLDYLVITVDIDTAFSPGIKESVILPDQFSGVTPIARSQSAEPLPKCFADLRSIAALNLRERSICSAVSTGGFQR